jgi:hypothetical protein
VVVEGEAIIRETDLLPDAELDQAARHVDGAGHEAVLELVFLAHIDDQPGLALVHQRLELVHGEKLDLLLRCADIGLDAVRVVGRCRCQLRGGGTADQQAGRQQANRGQGFENAPHVVTPCRWENRWPWHTPQPAREATFRRPFALPEGRP